MEGVREFSPSEMVSFAMALFAISLPAASILVSFAPDRLVDGVGNNLAKRALPIVLATFYAFMAHSVWTECVRLANPFPHPIAYLVVVPCFFVLLVAFNMREFYMWFVQGRFDEADLERIVQRRLQETREYRIQMLIERAQTSLEEARSLQAEQVPAMVNAQRREGRD